HPVDTEIEVKGDETQTVSLGKFKDANALLNAYNSLQSEFTKRCQRVKELESALSVDKENSIKENSPTEKVKEQEQAHQETKGITEEDKQNILKDYLKGLLGLKSTAVVMDGVGGGINTPINKPKTIDEAGKLAQEILR
ncbi:MAG: hypothetical protein J6R83_01480, partial [Clostridia bacterium]|nr:hypothetical protein [Clostridia bacterium]